MLRCTALHCVTCVALFYNTVLKWRGNNACMSCHSRVLVSFLLGNGLQMRVCDLIVHDALCLDTSHAKAISLHLHVAIVTSCGSHFEEAQWKQSLWLQEDMLSLRRAEFEDRLKTHYTWDGFVDLLDQKKMVKTPWYAMCIQPLY